MASSELVHRSFLEQPVVNLMRGKIATVGAKTQLYDVVDIMQQERIRHLPVVIGNELLGIVSDRDVRRALAGSALRDAAAQEKGEFYLGPIEVHEVMTKDVRTIPSSATAERAITELLRHGIHSLPIVDARQLVGIITDTDLLRAIGAEDKEAREP
jgi:acetoin utilization protein AcuB